MGNKKWRRLLLTVGVTLCAVIITACGKEGATPASTEQATASVANATASAPAVTGTNDAAIHVDQVGYLTHHNKIAVVSGHGGESFWLIDAKTNQTVYEGKLSAVQHDDNSGEDVSHADFTNFATPGAYRLVVGDKSSYEFVIGDNVYAVPLVQNLRSFTLSRSNTPMSDPLTGLNIAQGHPQTANAEVYYSDNVTNKGNHLDVSGGWYDAGDYGKYIPTGALASAELMLAYEAHPEHFTKGQLFFPQGVVNNTNMPDLLAEVKWEIDWMRKMQRSDGSTYHKVAGATWPGHDKSPDTDTQPFYIYGHSTFGTAMYGACLAIGARVYKQYDNAYAGTLLDRAKYAWQYLTQTPSPIYRNDPGQENGSGPYGKNGDTEERVWLAAELFKTTGDKVYENYLKEQQSGCLTQRPGFFTWDNTLALAQYAYITSPNADANLQERTRRAFLEYADEICRKIERDGFNCALSREEYTWASTKNAVTMGDILLMANHISPKKEYVEGALAQLHYMFGCNALNKSFMTGVGDNPPEHPHNRIHTSTGAYVPGLVVGGPNFVSGGDPDQTNLLSSGNIYPAKAYLDVLMSWSTNEYAIDYTAAASYMLAWFTEAEPKLTENDIRLTREFPATR